VNLSLVDHEQFEGIMERVSVFGSKSVSLEQIKLIASSVVLADLEDFDELSLGEASPDRSLHVN